MTSKFERVHKASLSPLQLHMARTVIVAAIAGINSRKEFHALNEHELLEGLAAACASLMATNFTMPELTVEDVEAAYTAAFNREKTFVKSPLQ